MKTGMDFEEGIAFRGNWGRLKRVMKKARSGQPVTVGFLGGSITQGCQASGPEACYAHLVYEWWKEKFPEAQITYVNAGIGGTTSQFGAARAKDDLLGYRPDFVVVEFSVNDENTPFFRETYEGLVRRICREANRPAAVLVHNVFYGTGINAQAQHEAVGRHYGLPCVSMKSSVYRQIAEGKLRWEDIAPDGLHPNDGGHKLLAELIIYLLEKVYGQLKEPEETAGETEKELPQPMTANAYENSVRYRNGSSIAVCDGFFVDSQKQEHITDVFKNGWVGENAGDSITLKVPGSGVALQYRKSVRHPACTAYAVVDGEESAPVFLDGNFDEAWGDCLYLHTLIVHGENREHTVKITVNQGKAGETVPFYLVSAIGSE